jgi:hypothetical protein
MRSMEVSPSSPTRARICPIPCGRGSPRPGVRPPPPGRAPRRAGVQVLGQLGAHHFVPAGEDQFHHWNRARRADPCGPAPWPWRRPHAAARCRPPPACGGARRSCRTQARRCGPPGPPLDPPGSGAAVVRMDWPVGSSATRARLRARVELGEDVVQQQGRDQRRSGQRRAGAPRCAGPGPGSAAPPGRRGSGPPARRWSRRSSRCGPTVLTPRRRSSFRLALKGEQQVSVPAPLVALVHHDPIPSPARRP